VRVARLIVAAAAIRSGRVASGSGEAAKAPQAAVAAERELARPAGVIRPTPALPTARAGAAAVEEIADMVDLLSLNPPRFSRLCLPVASAVLLTVIVNIPLSLAYVSFQPDAGARCDLFLGSVRPILCRPRRS